MYPHGQEKSRYRAAGLGRTMITINIQLPDNQTREFQHRGTRADVGVLEQIFKNQDYSLQRLARHNELHARFRNKTPLFFDCGANIGASVVWFAINFPDTHIVAFEPDPGNFELLKANTAGLNVDLRNSAVGCVDGRVAMLDPGVGEWGYRTKIDPKGKCELVSLSRVVQEKIKAGFAPFLIKIDIEGGEEELFSQSADWIDRFPILIIELHDWMLPKMGASRNFLRCISQYDRDFVHIGENIFSLQN
jgi:FkbM family methyltransferase